MNAQYETPDGCDPEDFVEYAPTPAEVVRKYMEPSLRTEANKPDPVTTTVRLYPGTVAELDRVAAILGISRSRLISELLEGALAEALREMEGGPEGEAL